MAHPALKVTQLSIGHSKNCKCEDCLADALKSYKQRMIMCLAGGARPKNLSQMVPVRAHFRRQRNYLKSNPDLRDEVVAMIKAVLRNK